MLEIDPDGGEEPGGADEVNVAWSGVIAAHVSVLDLPRFHAGEEIGGGESGHGRA